MSAWELVWGCAWSLLEPDPAHPSYDRSVICVDVDRGKYIDIVYAVRPLTVPEVESLLAFARDACSDIPEWWVGQEAAVTAALLAGRPCVISS